jgi:hypothetical protein
MTQNSVTFWGNQYESLYVELYGDVFRRYVVTSKEKYYVLLFTPDCAEDIDSELWMPCLASR